MSTIFPQCEATGAVARDLVLGGFRAPNSPTMAAAAPALGIYVDIIAAQRMAVFAVCFDLVENNAWSRLAAKFMRSVTPAAFSIHVRGVVRLRSDRQMVGIDTTSDIAFMKDYLTIWDGKPADI